MSFGERAEELEGAREDVRVNVGETDMRNSNSFAHQAVEVVTGDRPKPAAWAPGSRKRLKTDAPEKH